MPKTATRISILRQPALSEAEQSTIVEAAKSYVGRGYNYAGNAVVAVEKLAALGLATLPTNELIAALSKPVTTGIVGEWLGSDKLFCSQLVTEAYKAAKVQLPVLPLAAPGELIRLSQDGLLQTVGRLNVQATKAVPRSGLFSADWELTVKRLLA